MVSVRFATSGGVRLEGELSVPAAAGKREGPGVVLVSGSGPSERTNDGFFTPLRDCLNAAGVAVLSYDKRGAGGSSGDWVTATVDDLAGDALAAVAYLRAQPGVDADRVVLFGHSEGGWAALRAGSRPDSGAAGLVLNSTPADSFLESEEYALRVKGWPPPHASAARRLLSELADLASQGYGLEAAEPIVACIRDEPWYGRLVDAGFVLEPTMWTILRIWGSYDPASDLARLTLPTLVLLGGADPLVPVESSCAIYAGHAEVRVFPGAGHRMAVGASGLASGYLDTLTRWVRQARPRPSGC